MVMELKEIVERFGVKESESIICVNTILLEIEKHKSIPMQLPVKPANGGRKVEVIVGSKYFEEFTARTDIEILQVDVKAVEQSYMCQESFLAVIQYREC